MQNEFKNLGILIKKSISFNLTDFHTLIFLQNAFKKMSTCLKIGNPSLPIQIYFPWQLFLNHSSRVQPAVCMYIRFLCCSSPFAARRYCCNKHTVPPPGGRTNNQNQGSGNQENPRQMIAMH